MVHFREKEGGVLEGKAREKDGPGRATRSTDRQGFVKVVRTGSEALLGSHELCKCTCPLALVQPYDPVYSTAVQVTYVRVREYCTSSTEDFWSCTKHQSSAGKHISRYIDEATIYLHTKTILAAQTFLFSTLLFYTECVQPRSCEHHTLCEKPTSLSTEQLSGFRARPSRRLRRPG